MLELDGSGHQHMFIAFAPFDHQIAALRRIAGDKAAGLIRSQSDETIWRIVSDWPRDFDAARARALGFTADASFDDIIKAHIEDELGGKIGM